MSAPKGIVYGSESSCVAVCTLWTQLDRFTAAIQPSEYRLMGNLYSFNGISTLLRTLHLHPEVRHVILCGMDLGKAGEALVALFNNGIEPNHQIKGSTVIIEYEIPLEAIESLRQHVTLVDQRGIIRPEQIREQIAKCAHLPPFGKPQSFPATQPVNPSQFPSEGAGYLIHEDTVALAWPKALSMVLRFGSRKKSHYQDVKEIIGLTIVIGKEDPDKPALPPYMGLTTADLEDYYPQLITDMHFEGTSYTYGQRLRHVPKKARDEMAEIIDQIDAMVAELKEAQFSRRAIALTWRVDEDIANKNPPCLVLIQALVSEGNLHLIAYLRSNDMFSAWPKNAYGLRKMQQLIAQRVGLPLGTLTTISASAHVYEPDWARAQKVAENAFLRWRQDHRGYFVVKVEDRKIKLSHFDNNGPLLQQFEGTKAETIYKELVLKDTMLHPEHLAYMGMELAKAQIALEQGLTYVQEEDLRFK